MLPINTIITIGGSINSLYLQHCQSYLGRLEVSHPDYHLPWEQIECPGVPPLHLRNAFTTQHGAPTSRASHLRPCHRGPVAKAKSQTRATAHQDAALSSSTSQSIKVHLAHVQEKRYRWISQIGEHRNASSATEVSVKWLPGYNVIYQQDPGSWILGLRICLSWIFFDVIS